MLNYPTATVLTLVFCTWWFAEWKCMHTCSSFRDYFPWWAIWIMKAGWYGTSQSEAGILQINLNQILFDLSQHQRTISELMELLPVDPIIADNCLYFLCVNRCFFTSFYICLCSLSVFHSTSPPLFKVWVKSKSLLRLTYVNYNYWVQHGLLRWNLLWN